MVTFTGEACAVSVIQRAIRPRSDLWSGSLNEGGGDGIVGGILLVNLCGQRIMVIDC